LPLKVSQLKILFKENWTAIDRSKRRLSHHKAFLTKEGKKIIQDRKKDFDALFLIKERNSYVFTSDRNPSQHIGRQAIIMDVNKVTKIVSQRLPHKPNITSHSF
jgi:hypothetical protein